MRHALSSQVLLKPGEAMPLRLDAPWALLAGHGAIGPEIRIVAGRSADLPPGYLSAREAAWSAACERHGRHLWNSEIHTAESLDWEDGCLVLRVGRGEYKDIVAKRALGVEAIRQRWGERAVRRHMFSALMPMDDRRRVLLGAVGAVSIEQPGELDLIGGCLTVDDVRLRDFEDVRRHACVEFEEETGVAMEVAHARLCSINHDGHCVFFIFETRADLDEIVGKFSTNGELSAVVIASLMPDALLPAPLGKDVRFIRSYFPELQQS